MPSLLLRCITVACLSSALIQSSVRAQEPARPALTREIEAIILGGGGYYSNGTAYFQPTANAEFLAQTSALDLTVGYHFGFPRPSHPTTEGLHVGLRLPISASDAHHAVFADAALLLFDDGSASSLQAGVRADLGGRSGLLEYRAAVEVRRLPTFGTIEGGGSGFRVWGGLELGIAIPIYHRTIHVMDRKDTLRAELRAIATENELRSLEAASSDHEIDSWLSDFWSGHFFKGTTGEAAKGEYMRRVDTVNNRFGTPYRLGAGTDMGRAYLMFGQPDAIEDAYSTANPDRKYEMWTYYARLTGHQTALFLFVQFEGGRSDAGQFGAAAHGQSYVGLGGYKQIYSNVRGEDSYPLPTDLPPDMLNFIQSH